MPYSCAFGCNPTAGVVMHRFPSQEKFPERFKTWVTLCRGKLETSADYHTYKEKRVCDRHFVEKDHNRNKRLNALAVPSLYLAGISQCTDRGNFSKSSTSLQTNTVKEIPLFQTLEPEMKNLARSSPKSINTGKTSGTADKSYVLEEHNYSAARRERQLAFKKRLEKTQGFNCTQVCNMRTEIKQLRSEICRLKRNGNFMSRLKNAQKVYESVAFQRVLNRMTKSSQLFLNMQLQNVKKPKGRRFTTPEKILCLSIYKKSPKCYAFLQRVFTLPSAKAMKRLLSKIKLCPGINPVIFEKIKKTVAGKCLADKLCSLSFDEMSISPQIHYNNQKDTFEGFALNNDRQFADHALVFMVKGVKQNFKQPIAYYFTSCLKKIELKNIIKTVIRHAQDSGLIIINTVCDQSTVNVSAINELIDETKAIYLRKGVEWRYDCFSVKGRKIIPLFDTPHLIKGIRNNLLTKDLVYTTKNKEKIVKWEYYQKVYGADKSYGELKLLHKITEEHIDPEKINKMRVKTATQIFSHSVAVVTDHLTARGDLPEECRQLIDITLLLDNLFDSLNVSTLNIPDGKSFKGAVKYNSPHHELWRESKKVLKTVKFIKKRVSGHKIRLIAATVPSITNLIRTIEGVEAIWQVLFKKCGLDAMLTRNFNQDPVENFFGNIRSYGARNNAPNTICFEGAFKALLLNNYSAPHSSRANCEEDENECLQNLDFFITENYSTSIPEETSDIPEEIHFNEDLYIEMQYQEDAGQGNYVCGWVLTKCLKKICKSCQQCRQTLLNTANQRNKYIKAKEYGNKSWLCYPSEVAENCFHAIQNITKSFLKKNVLKKDIKKSIIVLCDVLVEYPFNCFIHKEKLKACFLDVTINIILYSWCRNINRILSGKITYEGEEDRKKRKTEKERKTLLFIIINVNIIKIKNNLKIKLLLF